MSPPESSSPSTDGARRWLPGLAIGGLSVVLVGGLAALGIVNRVNGWIGRTMGGDFHKALMPWVIWLAAVMLAVGMACVVIEVTGLFRRLALWLTTLALVAGWAIVLVLAARAPDVAAPFIATFWSGFCALVYAAKNPAS